MTQEQGFMETSPKFELRLQRIEDQMQALQREANSMIQTYADALDIDLGPGKWLYERGRFRRHDVRPPELTPELEVKPPTPAVDEH